MSALARVEARAATPARIDDLISWVVQADVEDVCWRITEIGSMREWAHAQKDATDLRKRAVRLELIALRKVAVGGLAAKIAGAPLLRSAARWLATLTDDEFSTVLFEIDGEKSPIALYRADKAQRDAMASALRDDRGSSDWSARTDWNRSVKDDEHLRGAATALLADLVTEGEPFTVSEAAEQLAKRLDLSVEVRSETADGLRAMVRSAITKGNRTSQHWSGMPAVFTVEDADGSYTRVPAERATLGHLRAHEREVRDHAEAAMRRADDLRELLADLLRRAGSGVFDAEGEMTEQADELMDRRIASLMDIAEVPA